MLEISHALPPFIQHGIPPPLALMPDTPWWTNDTSTELSDTTRAIKNTCGIEDQFVGDSIFLNWLRPYAHFSAKVAFATMNGAGKQHELPDIASPVDGSPPEKANAFSDGSFSIPELPMYSLTSAGVWWPTRDMQNAPLSALEEDSTHYVQRKSGLELLSFLNGPISSSSRAELFGPYCHYYVKIASTCCIGLCSSVITSIAHIEFFNLGALFSFSASCSVAAICH